MRFVSSKHPPGTVGYITGGTPRYFEFSDSIEETRAPHGSTLLRARSCNPVKNCNQLLSEMKGDWMWFQGDDHAWDPDLLLRLLDRDVDAIVPLVPRWAPPFATVIYKDWSPNGKCETYSWQEIDWLLQSGKEVIDVAAAGSAGLLIRRHVLDALRREFGEPVFRVGAAGKDELSEDTELTWKIAQMGFTMACDLTAFMEHLTTVRIGPYRMKDGRIAVTGNVHGGRMLAFAAALRDEAAMAEAAE